MENTLYTIAEKALIEKFNDLIDKEKIEKIIKTSFDESLIENWIKDYIEYGDGFIDILINMLNMIQVNNYNFCYECHNSWPSKNYFSALNIDEADYLLGEEVEFSNNGREWYPGTLTNISSKDGGYEANYCRNNDKKYIYIRK